MATRPIRNGMVGRVLSLTFSKHKTSFPLAIRMVGEHFFDEAQDQFIFYLDNISTEPEVYPSEEVEGQRLYPIGSYNWIWEEVTYSIG